MARPKRVFSEEEEQKIEEYALNNCHFDTIALAMSIPVMTLKRRYGRFIKQKRAEGRIRLRGFQVALAETNPAMSIFLGKNELEQTDKQTITTEQKAPELTAAERKACEASAKVYKLHLARQGTEEGPSQAAGA